MGDISVYKGSRMWVSSKRRYEKKIFFDKKKQVICLKAGYF